AYATRQAAALGLSCAVLTVCGADTDPKRDLPWACAEIQSSTETTTFQNIYSSSGRVQRLLALAPSLDFARMPTDWRRAPIVLLGPVAGEIATDAASFFAPETLIGVGAQG